MNKLSKPQAIIFDMDGTIVDSEGFAVRVWKEAGSKLNLEIPESILTSMIGSSVAKTDSLFLEEYGLDFPIQKLRQKKTEIEMSLYGQGLLLEKKGAFELLKMLKEAQMSLGLATSTERYRAEQRLLETNLGDFFVYARFGDEVTNQKPDPEIYLDVARNLNTPIQRCLVIEDSISGVMAGLASGAQVVWIKDIVHIPLELEKQVLTYSSLDELKKDLTVHI